MEIIIVPKPRETGACKCLVCKSLKTYEATGMTIVGETVYVHLKR